MRLRHIAQNAAAHARRLSSAAAVAKEDMRPTFLVFGATGGIGSELVRLLASQHPGATLALAGRSQEKLEALAAELANASATIHPVDVLDAKDVERVTSEVASSSGRLDGVASLVGSVTLKPAHTTTPEEFETTVRVNLFSTFNVLRAAVKPMMKNPDGRGGSIAFCTSAVARHGIPNHEAIAAAKGGVASLALSAAATYAPKNIRANCVAPGLTRTPMTARITSNESALKASEAMHALRRIGEPREPAAALAFLLDPANSFITGQILAVDGGLSSLRPQ